MGDNYRKVASIIMSFSKKTGYTFIAIAMSKVYPFFWKQTLSIIFWNLNVPNHIQKYGIKIENLFDVYVGFCWELFGIVFCHMYLMH